MVNAGGDPSGNGKRQRVNTGQVLARVTKDVAAARGPDGLHRLQVPKEWLDRGEAIEFDLPRHLTCARCQGGGCDVCERSGAVTTRGKDELAELIEVTLPVHSPDPEGAPITRRVMIRIPDRGGLPADATLPRGLLLISVSVGDADVADERVRLSAVPPAPAPVPAPVPVPSRTPGPLRIPVWGWAAAAAIALAWTLAAILGK